MDEKVLANKRILLGVTGSIAAYKAADLASRLTKAGAEVDVVLTQAAEKFVSALTFRSLTGRKAYVEDDFWEYEQHVPHIHLGRAADLVLIAPVTAQTMARLAQGMADTLLTAAVLAAECPLALAPAMDVGMFEHVATQVNVQILKERGVEFIGPAEGRMASGLAGRGRLVEPQEICGHVRRIMGRDGSLAGRHVVVTAGGTREALDPVRFLGNRSSGKQGYALAQAALDAGARVTLISSIHNLPVPVGAELIPVTSAADMQQAVLDACDKADVLLMAAAVADFKPQKQFADKIKKKGEEMLLPLAVTEDILARVATRRREVHKPQVVVGFAAETEDLLANAKGKLERKALDFIVANDVSQPDAGFGVDTNRVTILPANGDPEQLPLQSKFGVARAVIARVATLLTSS